MKGKQNKAWILIALGIVVAAVPLAFYIRERGRNQRYIDSFWQDEVQKTDDKTNKENNKTKKTKEDKEDKEDKEKDTQLSGEDVIGIIEIPSLHIEYPIFEGTGNVQLNEGIGHMESTAPLCENGNCVLAGHNGSSRGTYFTYLNNIEVGATVRVTNKNKVTHEYKVQEMKIVNPYDKWVTEETDTEQLTLFTCANHGSNRFAVKCTVNGS